MRPSALSLRITGPCIGCLSPHAIQEEKEHAEENDEGHELEDQPDEEDLVIAIRVEQSVKQVVNG